MSRPPVEPVADLGPAGRRGGDLFLCLRLRGKRRNRRGRNGAGRVDISERPAIVEGKVRVGDWEVDTIMGTRHSGATVSPGDRASKFTFLQPVNHKTSADAVAAIIDCLGPVSDPVLATTDDSGREFAGHAEVSRALGVDFTSLARTIRGSGG